MAEFTIKQHTITGGNGIKLHVEETGNPTGRPLLFIHGFSQCRFAWDHQTHSSLAEKNRMITMDLRGHGLSEKPENAYDDPKLWADDINAIIETLELHQPVLIGWSYGGLVISDYLRVYGDKAIGGIHFVGAISRVGVPESGNDIGADFLALIPGFFSNDVMESAAAIETFMGICVYEPLPPQALYYSMGYNMIVPPYVRKALFSRSIESGEVLRSITKPVLISHGEEDEIVLVDVAKNYHEKMIPHAQTSYYPHVGHSPFSEDSQRFNSELQAFVNRL